MKRLSVTRLSEKLNVNRNDILDRMVELKLIYKKNKKWILTEQGEKLDAKVIQTEKEGKKIEFIAWPETFDPFRASKQTKMEIVNATKIGKRFGISSQRVNNILSEIGWIEKAIKGWNVTLTGSRSSGIQKQHPEGGTYVVWPTDIFDNNIFLRTINSDAITTDQSEDETIKIEPSKAQSKYPTKMLKSKDGHMVRSRGELVIDNMLYDYGITHAYERELPIAETVKCDFYIPPRNGGMAVYIEFWGISNDEEYLHRKKMKQEIYKRENYNLINIEEHHLDNLDGYLPKELLQYKIKVE